MQPETTQATPPAQSQPVVASPAPAGTDEDADLWRRIRGELSWQSIDNSRIDRQRKALLRQSSYMDVVSERANYYLFHIVEEVDARGMPMEIALIPLVESMLDPFAASYSGAAGLWQIMPRTGRHLGLEQTTWYDGRQALHDSTNAALDYLQALHDRFDGDWLLAVAAYNAGQGTISRARKDNAARGQATDYWSLKLRRQAMDYVPKIIAVAQVIATPEYYGVTIPPVPNAPSFEITQAPTSLHLSQVADLAGVHVDEVRALNAGQLRGATSPHRDAELLLPLGSSEQFHAKLAQLDPGDRIAYSHSHKVKAGDSLWKLARRYDTNVAILRDMNNLKGNNIRIGDTLQIPGHYGAGVATAGDDTTPQGYLVRAGDSLYRIASRFKVSVSNIVAWNGLDPNDYLQPGQKLTLYISGH